MKKGYKNITASLRQRLLNKARETGRPFNELLQYFAMERFLYRLSKSPYADDCQGNLESTRSLVGITAYPAHSFNQRRNTRVLRLRLRLWNPL